jgi:cell wall assembly regulator SMI1
MDEIWRRIESWLKQNAPEILTDLQPGASDADIQNVVQAVSYAMPDDFIESYRIHDGKRGGSAPLLDQWELLSLSAIVKEWQNLKKLSDDGLLEGMEGDSSVQIKSDWWNLGWIPFASNSSGDFLCIDLDPPQTGKKGQVISYWHSDSKRKLLAKDFRSWLAEFVEDLESGKYRFVDDWLTKIE